jgi:hypothetical protein
LCIGIECPETKFLFIGYPPACGERLAQNSL